MTTGMSWVVAAALAAAFLLIGGGVYFYDFAIRRSKKKFMQETADFTDMPGKPWQDRSAWLEAQPYEVLEIQSFDELKLQGYFLEARAPSNRVVILVHGYTGKGKAMACFAQLYREQLGFHVLMPDCRGHGKSEGEYLGFGWHDRLDMIEWIRTMVQRIGKDAEIVLHGVSMGGGTVLMTSGEQLPTQVRCIISDCAYSSVIAIQTYHLKRMFKLPAFPIINVTSWICKLRAGYFLSEASAIKQVAKTDKPILFIHGGKDLFVPTSMVYELYESASAAKQLFIVDEAGHGNAYWTDMEGYTEQMGSFLRRYVPSMQELR